MIFHPPVVALIVASLLTVAVLAAAAIFALRLLAGWDATSGSARQIGLERTTLLVSTLVAFVLVLEAVSLVLFAVEADRMAPLFVGAMCAVGTLMASPWGFPTLWAKIAVFFAAFVWLAIDRVDGRTRDHALIRPKYAALLAVAPLVFAEAGLEIAHFLDLRPDTITSCCGKLFGETRRDLGGDLASLDPAWALALLAGTLTTAVATALAAQRRRALAVVHGIASAALFFAALTAIVAAIGPYVYEQPHHHCPFCILKHEYGHVGFALYLPLFVATGAGLATSALALLGRKGAARTEIDAAIGRLTRAGVIADLLFGAVAVALVLHSGLKLL